ncbi:hypothetical protein [Saccharibacillus sacchari]|uniref:Uncharacterized protein n=1 Tax=Saccharibacillus sacchari TaxID=456493 RepID=A0ACC6PFV2_9BACL
MMLKKHNRSILRFVLAILMIVVGILMSKDNLIAGIFSLAVATYALVSGILWLRVERRPQVSTNPSKPVKRKK